MIHLQMNFTTPSPDKKASDTEMVERLSLIDWLHRLVRKEKQRKVQNGKDDISA